MPAGRSICHGAPACGAMPSIEITGSAVDGGAATCAPASPACFDVSTRNAVPAAPATATPITTASHVRFFDFTVARPSNSPSDAVFGRSRFCGGIDGARVTGPIGATDGGIVLGGDGSGIAGTRSVFENRTTATHDHTSS